ncbi:C6 zinc finger domain-containing protein [Arthroderma uncinatum]|uniref:C6 zinc finger domain-containing protein n=1 Tax=Arthroderma uncinatum TaxID=74035 RepID=UPI00144A5B03|nr:C6 zinc finger domain-containing protein [Arthroderma uncinatum]KAF3483746.1 C6 zinc finger domain-containing protein [Arthroderma uncinatum]
MYSCLYSSTKAIIKAVDKAKINNMRWQSHFTHVAQGHANPLPNHQNSAQRDNDQSTQPRSANRTEHGDLQTLSGITSTANRRSISNTPIFLPPGAAARESPESSSTSEEIFQQFSPVSTTDGVNTPSDLHRVSVKSLLSHSIPPGPGPDDVRNYGLDCGQPDLDMHRDVEFLASLHDTSSLGNAYSSRIAPYSARASDTGTPSSSPEDITIDTRRSVTTVFSKGVAIEDENILNLLLAYSASHRARLLGHAEPYTRIAHWTSGVFPSLRHALSDPSKKTSAATLATAIMLVSLKVISPTTFEVPIRWESHLMTAREIFLARQKADLDNFTGPVNSFLHRWLGYLDIFGSLSSRRTEPPLFDGAYWSLENSGEEGQSSVVDKEFEIDCFTGFTPRCCSFLARLGELTHQCDNVRVDPAGRLFTSWNPPATVIGRAEQLLHDMQEASPDRTPGRRTHHQKPVEPNMAAVDEAYRLAGMIHLHRRVFGRETSDPVVRDLVDALVDALNQVSRGGQEEVCVLFPLFTAGCESQNASQRQQASKRVQGFESVGMKQIRRARKLMQRSWQEGLPWNVLADGEFLG